jgi:hypothetical protein
VFTEALTEIVRRLDEAKARQFLDDYALIGGFAVSAWGVPRATHDLDFALALGATDPEAVSRYLHADFQPGEPEDPLRGVFRASVAVHDPPVPVQLVLLPSTWDAIIFQGVESLQVFGCAVPVVAWPALVLMKLYAGEPQDLLDAQQILAVRKPTKAEQEAIAALAATVGLSDAWRRLLAR